MMRQRTVFLLCGLLVAGMCCTAIHAATYNNIELTKLRTFLLQESAEAGVKNYQQLGLKSMDDVDWGSVPGLYWNRSTFHLERVTWDSRKLSGHLDLSGFVELKALNCPFNKIKSVDVSNSKELQRMDFYTNELSFIDVTTNPLINYLRLGYNNISSIDLSNNTYLGFFCCTGNRIESLDVSDKAYLYEFYCVNNKIHTLLMDNCTSLKLACCDLNRITNLHVNNLPALKTLNCTYNGMKTLLLTNCDKLEEMMCQYNDLDTLDVSNCVSLTKLVCNRNQLTSLTLEGCKNLTSLNCEYNLLTSLDVSSSPLLSTLYCKNNYLSFLTLPLPTQRLTDYDYNPQYDVVLESEYNNIDFSEFFNIKDNISVYIWSQVWVTTPIPPLESSGGRFAFDESFIGRTLLCRVQNFTYPNTVMRYLVTMTNEIMNNLNVQNDKSLIYAGDRSIHVQSDAPAWVSIYSLAGRLVTNRQVDAGHTVLPFERGAYVAVINNVSYKVIVR